MGALCGIPIVFILTSIYFVFLDAIFFDSRKPKFMRASSILTQYLPAAKEKSLFLLFFTSLVINPSVKNPSIYHDVETHNVMTTAKNVPYVKPSIRQIFVYCISTPGSPTL